jgi:hypothetical protein
MNTEVCSVDLEGRNPLGDIRIDGRLILKRVLGKHVWKIWSGFGWLRIGTNGDLL